jgi:hypothetical protein
VLTIVILALLTAGALALLKWYQRRSAAWHHTTASQVALVNRVLKYDDVRENNNTAPVERFGTPEVADSLNVWKADYEQFLLQ